MNKINIMSFPDPPKGSIPITEDQYCQMQRYMRDKYLLHMDVKEPEIMEELRTKSKQERKEYNNETKPNEIESIKIEI
jgi:hypothetical protein